MKRLPYAMLAAALLLSACVSGGDVSRSSTPAPSVPTVGQAEANLPKVLRSQYEVKAVSVSVPQKLRVSEANMFYPIADIVWRGEPLADRHIQVQRIFEEAAATATSGMIQGPAVLVDLEVKRFHSVTEKTRYTVGGVHDMVYVMTLRDAATGAVIEGPREIKADVRAAGGAQAVAEDNMGRTQRVVIIERLVASLKAELSAQVTDPLLVSQALGLQPAGLSAAN